MKVFLILSTLLALAYAMPKDAGTCKCPIVSCPKTQPVKCQCQNEAATKCHEKCGGVVPKLQDCSIYEQPKCECEQVFCVQTFPESCMCENDSKKKCFEKCGGVQPTYQNCSAESSKPVTADPPKQSSPPKKSFDPSKYSRCGSRGMKACKQGYKCIDNPNLKEGDCGMSCDNPGYCVPENY